jgi:hypothetical protein
MASADLIIDENLQFYHSLEVELASNSSDSSFFLEGRAFDA